MDRLRFVFKRGHPNWRMVCKAIGAEFIQIKEPNNNFALRKFFFKLQLPLTVVSALLKFFFVKKHNKSVYILSGIQPVFLPIFMRILKREKNKIIVIVNDASFDMKNRKGLIKSFYEKLIFPQLDGAIAISPLVADMTRKYVKKVKYVMDPIWRGHAYFAKNNPDFNSNDFLHTGKYQKIKGIDLTAETMRIVNEELNTRFFVLGDGMKENFQKEELYDISFICPGYTDPMKYMDKVKFYVQIARLEAGGTAVLEAMAAGIIPFVNKTVGHRNIVAKIDKKLVVSSEPETAAKQIIEFVKKTPKQKIAALSKKCREITKKNDLKPIVNDFRLALAEMTK